MSDLSRDAQMGAEAALAVVAYSMTDRRVAERLQRADLSVEVVEPAALDAPPGGKLFLAAADRVSVEHARLAAALGAHVVLIPPWPLVGEPGPGAQFTIAPALDRSRVRLLMEPTQGGASTAQSLRILYREQLIGALGSPLAQTVSGETVLASLPRVSNRHGHTLATTLLLGTPSAQTDLADVALLLHAVVDWLARVPLDRDTRERDASQPTTEADETIDERSTQIALLAVALSLPAAMQSDEETVLIGPGDVISIRATFESLARRFEPPATRGGFQQSWEDLYALVGVAGVPDALRPEALRTYMDRWQLAARIRRLRHTPGKV